MKCVAWELTTSLIPTATCRELLLSFPRGRPDGEGATFCGQSKVGEQDLNAPSSRERVSGDQSYIHEQASTHHRTTPSNLHECVNTKRIAKDFRRTPFRAANRAKDFAVRCSCTLSNLSHVFLLVGELQTASATTQARATNCSRTWRHGADTAGCYRGGRP